MLKAAANTRQALSLAKLGDQPSNITAQGLSFNAELGLQPVTDNGDVGFGVNIASPKTHGAPQIRQCRFQTYARLNMRVRIKRGRHREMTPSQMPYQP